MKVFVATVMLPSKDIQTQHLQKQSLLVLKVMVKLGDPA